MRGDTFGGYPPGPPSQWRVPGARLGGGERWELHLGPRVMMGLSWHPCWLAFRFSRALLPPLRGRGAGTLFLQFLAFWFFRLEAQLGSLTPFGYFIPQGEKKVRLPVNFIVFFSFVQKLPLQEDDPRFSFTGCGFF